MSEERQLTPLSVRLKEARKNRGLSADRIAEGLDCSPSTVRHWWTARSEPSFDTLEKYAQLCGVSPYWLITGRPDADEVLAAFLVARRQWAKAVAEGEDAAAAWERILGRNDLFSHEDRRRLSSDSADLAQFLVSLDGVKWIELGAEEHRVVEDLVRLLAKPRR